MSAAEEKYTRKHLALLGDCQQPWCACSTHPPCPTFSSPPGSNPAAPCRTFSSRKQLPLLPVVTDCSQPVCTGRHAAGADILPHGKACVVSNLMRQHVLDSCLTISSASFQCCRRSYATQKQIAYTLVRFHPSLSEAHVTLTAGSCSWMGTTQTATACTTGCRGRRATSAARRRWASAPPAPSAAASRCDSLIVLLIKTLIFCLRLFSLFSHACLTTQRT